jgi:hypothetical protein
MSAASHIRIRFPSVEGQVNWLLMNVTCYLAISKYLVIMVAWLTLKILIYFIVQFK